VAPEVPEASYGQFVLRTKVSDYAAFLNVIEDKAFLESNQIVKKHNKMVNHTVRDVAKVHHQIFGMICDLTPSGEKLIMDLLPKCPSCGSRNMKEWQQVAPKKLWPLPPVQHTAWDAKSEDEKKLEVDRLLSKFTN
jgi:CRISPR/Cas system CMR-associated protein Cmr1 (group 7 of RAMP superfamily)